MTCSFPSGVNLQLPISYSASMQEGGVVGEVLSMMKACWEEEGKRGEESLGLLSNVGDIGVMGGTPLVTNGNCQGEIKKF